MVNNNFLEAAKRRWPANCVGGSGRYALYTPSMEQFGKILLFETREEAERHIVDRKRVQIVDLLEPVVPNIRDDYEDRQWEKRFGR